MARKKGIPTNGDITPKVLMSEDQQRLAALIENAPNDAPMVESITDLTTRLEMIIPKIIRKSYPDRAYRWIATDNYGELYNNGGPWVPVNSHNHPAVWDTTPELFGNHGGIVYKNQNVLCFMRREIGEAIEAQTIKEFDFKVQDNVENLEKQYHGAGKGTVTVERIEDPGDGRNETELVADEDYDFSDTGTG